MNIQTYFTTLCSLIFFCSIDISASFLISDKLPIIIVPGILDANIKITRNFSVLSKQNFKQLALRYNNDTRKTDNRPGVHTTITELSLTDLHLFSNLLDYPFLWKLEYKIVSFDMRKGPNEQQYFFRNLENSVEELYVNNKHKKVVILAQGLGANMVVEFLRNQNQQWKDRHVKSMVSIGAPYGGNFDYLKALLMGPKTNLYNINKILPEEIASVLRTFPSIFYGLPNEKAYEKKVLIKTANESYTSKSISKFLRDSNMLTGFEMYNDMLPYRNNSLIAPGVELHVIYGNLVSTPEMLYFNTGCFCNNADTQPAIIYGNGDGITNVVSLRLPEKWNITDNHKIIIKEFSNCPMQELGAHSEVKIYVKRVIVSSASSER